MAKKIIRCSSFYVCRNDLLKLFVLALEAVKGVVIISLSAVQTCFEKYSLPMQ